MITIGKRHLVRVCIQITSQQLSKSGADNDEAIAHQIEAGCDLFVMASRYEPCGLNQLYSLRYGTVPLVHSTGGLIDTIVDTTPETLTEGSATGFHFSPFTSAALDDGITYASPSRFTLYTLPEYAVLFSTG